MPKVSVIMPVYNVERFVEEAICSVLKQDFGDLELIIVNDCSTDNSLALCQMFDDERIRIIQHDVNYGLAAARNTGIRHARADILAFLDSDDSWRQDKLALHTLHLERCKDVGVSFSRSAFIEEDGTPNKCYQMPRLKDIEPGYYLCRNPIGNGSAPVIRREVLDDIAFFVDLPNGPDLCYFNESLRQSEDIECWIRIALKTNWVIEGIPQPLTNYRLNAGGLSANLYKQLESWERVIELTRSYAPAFIAQWGQRARAYQLRYLSRQAIRLGDGVAAKTLVMQALKGEPWLLVQEPGRTLLTLLAAYAVWMLPRGTYHWFEEKARIIIGKIHHRKISQETQNWQSELHFAKQNRETYL